MTVTVDARARIVKIARWAVANHSRFTYSEGADRMADVHKPFAAKITCDCSAFVTYCYAWAGAPDPNGLAFNGEGYTGTLLSHNEHIALFKQNAQHVNIEQVLPGDLIVYGPGTGEHVAIVVQATTDSLTVSHGKPGDPSFVKVSQDGREPQTYLRCNTTQVRPPAPFPVPTPKPTGAPTAAQLAAKGFVALTDITDARTANRNGWNVFIWGGLYFKKIVAPWPAVKTWYVNAKWKTKNPA